MGEVLKTRKAVYQLGDHYIAMGGFGTVWKAYRRDKRTTVAIKRLHKHLAADQMYVSFLREEANHALVRGLRHPNIATILDQGDDDAGTPFIVMEWIEGETLKDRLDKSHGGLPVADVVNILRQLLEALGQLHGWTIVHRDIKPANIMITPQRLVKLLDLGIATQGRADGVVVIEEARPGTPRYAAPEQMKPGEMVDWRADQYALGVTAYEALVGGNPFATRPVLKLRDRADVPAALIELVEKAMRDKPECRYQRISDMTEVLVSLRLGDDSGTSTMPPLQVPPPSSQTHKRSIPRIAAALTSIGVIALALVLWPRSPTVVTPAAAPTSAPAIQTPESPQLVALPPSPAPTALVQILPVPTPTLAPSLDGNWSGTNQSVEISFAVTGTQAREFRVLFRTPKSAVCSNYSDLTITQSPNTAVALIRDNHFKLPLLAEYTVDSITTRNNVFNIETWFRSAEAADGTLSFAPVAGLGGADAITCPEAANGVPWSATHA